MTFRYLHEQQLLVACHIMINFQVKVGLLWISMLSMYLYNDVNATRAVIGRCPWSIRVQIHGWRHGKLVFFVLFNMTRGFENVCEIISDCSKWKLWKRFSRSYLQRGKMEKRRPKKLLTTWQCLNYKKSSQKLCLRYERLAVLQNVFAITLLWARKDGEKLFEETVHK